MPRRQGRGAQTLAPPLSATRRPARRRAAPQAQGVRAGPPTGALPQLVAVAPAMLAVRGGPVSGGKAGPKPLRLLAEERLHHSYGYPLELHPGVETLHELVHLLRVNGCGPDLVRRIRLFHALVGPCPDCAAKLAHSAESELRVHCVELRQYWGWICSLTPRRYKKTCPCVGRCPYSHGFVRPRLTAGPSRSFPLAPWLIWPPPPQKAPVSRAKRLGRSGTPRSRR